MTTSNSKLDNTEHSAEAGEGADAKTVQLNEQRRLEWMIIGQALFTIVAHFFLCELSLILLVAVTWIVFCFFVFYLRANRWRIRIRTLIITTTAISVLLSAFLSHWPLRIRLELSRSALESAVSKAIKGEEIEQGWFGLFYVHDIKVRQRDLSTQVSFDSSWSLGSFEGVVYAPQGPNYLNSNADLKLTKDWYYVLGD